jgi:hypothetical protein
MSPWDFGGAQPGQGGEYDEYGEYRQHGEQPGFGDQPEFGNSDDFDGGNFSPISYERDPFLPEDFDDYAGPVNPGPRYDTTPLGLPLGGPLREQLGEPLGGRARSRWPDESWPPRVPQRPARPRWAIPAAVALAVALLASATSFLLISGHPARSPMSTPPASPSVGVTAQPTAGGSAPLTLAQARQILVSYTSANNSANAQMSNALLGTIETGSSYAIDAGIYRVKRAEKAPPYPAFGPRQSRFYIPRLAPAQYPHWFVVEVVNATLASPGKSDGTEYLLFTQAAPGAPWRNAVEPYLVGGAAVPQVTVGADGLAIPVNPDTRSLAIAPGVVGQLTAAALDGGKQGVATPANLADRLDAGFWHQKLPSAKVLDRHMISDGQVFGLQTSDGGALLFYTDAALLTLVPPAGEAMHLTIPGFYSPSQNLSVAVIGYLEQFATYVPPRGGAGMRVVADYSGMTGRH